MSKRKKLLAKLQHHHHQATHTGQGLANKRFIKLIAACPNKNLRRTLIKVAPDGAIKGICNAALNVARNSKINLPPAIKAKFRHHKTLFNQLLNRKISIRKKRHTLLQSGGALPLIPIILSTILGSLGSALFNKN